MFVVFGFFGLFLDAGKPMRLVPALFAATIPVAGVLGAAVAHFYSEPMNRRLRSYFDMARTSAPAVDGQGICEVRY